MNTAELPRAFLVSTGTEITQGAYADTNAQEISRRLTTEGFRIVGHAAVPDDADAIEDALRHAAARSALVVSTGGIGPTEDDLTRDIVAKVWQRPLRRIHRAEAAMRARFARRGVPFPERNLQQALVPTGSAVLFNHWGTACAFFVPPTESMAGIVALPGVPPEWRSMWDRHMARLVLPAYPTRATRALHTLHLALIPESTANEALKDVFTADPRVEVTILAKRGVLRLRLVATDNDPEVRDELLEKWAAVVRQRLPDGTVYDEGPEESALERVVVARFAAAGRKLALAESCTGGGIARRVTDVAGSSAVLREGLVTYSNESKVARLGVSEATLAEHGAVSGECAREMARGALAANGADVALAVTGIAGPDGGSAEKPVGTVWFGVADRNGLCQAFLRRFPGDRGAVRVWAENTGLELLRRWIEGLDMAREGEWAKVL